MPMPVAVSPLPDDWFADNVMVCPKCGKNDWKMSLVGLPSKPLLMLFHCSKCLVKREAQVQKIATPQDEVSEFVVSLLNSYGPLLTRVVIEHLTDHLGLDINDALLTIEALKEKGLVTEE